MGPACADDLIQRDGRAWHQPDEKQEGKKV
jgi:glucose-6-phosphate 1-dehydrogenase